MGTEKVIFESERWMKRGEVASYLRTLADQVEAGKIALGPGAGEALPPVPEDLVLEIKAEEKIKKDGTKFIFEVEIEWKVAASAGREAQVSS